ncbi:unnamed protein product [Prorocentrum cordatum]|uniref:Uncharacterized protein n=1 Tax=Prorocentrum cordatum TaxID=2364126 RepID=A0ABN9WXU8_9DINO|nr:unnamed protein product [Polarella glacialis]
MRREEADGWWTERERERGEQSGNAACRADPPEHDGREQQLQLLPHTPTTVVRGKPDLTTTRRRRAPKGTSGLMTRPAPLLDQSAPSGAPLWRAAAACRTRNATQARALWPGGSRKPSAERSAALLRSSGQERSHLARE